VIALGAAAAATELEAAWDARVRGNREQVDRIREVPDGDFYAPVSQLFRADPARADDPVLGRLVALARRGSTSGRAPAGTPCRSPRRGIG
jgi:hypothetical protein